MTEETKRYIAVSDVLALRLTCKKCGASTTRQIKQFYRAVDKMCGNCNTPWQDIANGAAIKEIEELVRLLGNIDHLLEKERFNLNLEIASPKD